MNQVSFVKRMKNAKKGYVYGKLGGKRVKEYYEVPKMKIMVLVQDDIVTLSVDSDNGNDNDTGLWGPMN